MSINQMTFKQGQTLARFINALRPDWHTAGIEDALGNAREMAPAAELAHAAIRAATIASNRTPAVIPLEGPHWLGAAVAPRVPHDPAAVCHVCSQRREKCAQLWRGEHEFRPMDRTRAIRPTPAPASLRESLHGGAPAATTQQREPGETNKEAKP